MGRTRRVRQWVIDWPVRVVLTVGCVMANLVGAVVVFALARWVLPEGPLVDPGGVRYMNAVAFVVYIAVTIPIGLYWARRWFRLRHADEEVERRRKRRMVLYGPLRIVVIQGTLWVGGVAVFVALNVGHSLRLAFLTGDTILLGGIATCALSYLISERILRRTAALVLSEEPAKPRRGLPGIVTRSVLFWAFGSAVPVVGLIVSASAALLYGDVPASRLAAIVIIVGFLGILSGFLVTVGAARAVADPVNAVRTAMRRVEHGELGTEVTVYDGTELGQLQSGFNTMVTGLRERERLRDRFSRQVGHDVARAAEASDEVRLGGERRRVGVLFVDLVGSTALAAQRPPEEVVGLLNRMFAVVVDVVEQHGGWINKFEGDAALAVFGAPAPIPDPAGSALAAGRVLAARLAREVPDARAGIGVSAGDAVAGNVGDVRRYEYTVIGDPVNEAARLTELAKTTPGLLLASAAAVELAADEAAHWELGEQIQLRGRPARTAVAAPVVRAAVTPTT